jgi:hypothetical protein
MLKVLRCSITKLLCKRLGDYVLYVELEDSKVKNVRVELLQNGVHAGDQPPQVVDTLLQIFLGNPKGFQDWLDELRSQVVRMDTEGIQGRES